MSSGQILSFGAIAGGILIMSSSLYYSLCGIFAAGLYFLRHWSQGEQCKFLTKMNGKTVVITGGNAGIGKATARLLSQRGAKVIIGSRNLEKSRKAAEEIQNETGNEVIALALDLSSFASIRKFAQEVLDKTGDTIDVLINNAGIMFIPEERTEDGNEKQIQVNHLGHFLLTSLLLPKLLKARKARIINLSSLAHTWAKNIDADDLNLTKEGYGQVKAYAKSKLANILFTQELHRRYKNHGVYSFAVHPGTVSSEISVHIEDWFPKWWNATIGSFIKFIFLKSAENGAQTTLHCALLPDPELFSGSYFAECNKVQPSKAAEDLVAQAALWAKSIEITNASMPSDADISMSNEDSTIELEIPADAPIMKIYNQMRNLEATSQNPGETFQENMELAKKAGLIPSGSTSTEDEDSGFMNLKENEKKRSRESSCSESEDQAEQPKETEVIAENITEDVLKNEVEIQEESVVILEEKPANLEENQRKRSRESSSSSSSSESGDGEAIERIEEKPMIDEIAEKETEIEEKLINIEENQRKRSRESSTSSSSESEAEKIPDTIQESEKSVIEIDEIVEKVEEIKQDHDSNSTEDKKVEPKEAPIIDLASSSESEDEGAKVKETLNTNIESFDKSSLKNVMPEVKDVLPD